MNIADIETLDTLETGTLTLCGRPYRLVYLTPAHLPAIRSLHDHVIACLPEAEKSFILPRTDAYFAGHFTRGGGSAVLGAVSEGILVAKTLILHPDASGADMGGANPTSPPEQTSILQSATVHPDFRGNGLMQSMIQHWMNHARIYGKIYAAAEIEVRNSNSWNNFLKAGLSIVRVGSSPVDGAQVYSAQERIKYAMVKELEPRIETGGPTVSKHCAPDDIDTQKKLLSEGYVIAGRHAENGDLILEKPEVA